MSFMDRLREHLTEPDEVRQARERERQAAERDRQRKAAEPERRRAEEARQEQVFRMLRAAARVGTLRRFPGLGVQVAGAEVYTIGRDDYERLDTSVLLGQLAGAEAVVTGGTSDVSAARVAAFGVAGAMARKAKADAIIVLADGTTHAWPLSGNGAVRAAQREAVLFNAAARASCA